MKVLYLIILSVALLSHGTQSSIAAENSMQYSGILEYEVHGKGEVVLLIHGAYIQDAMLALANEPALSSYQLIRYYRRGYGGSDKHEQPFSIEGEAADALDLLDTLDVDKIHLVGYSSGGVIATQIALMAPERVESLILLEPALDTAVIDNPTVPESALAIINLYNSGDKLAALEGFLGMVGGANWRVDYEILFPESIAQIEENNDLFFQGELQGVFDYRLPEEKAVDLRLPTLLILSDEGLPLAYYSTSLRQWLPQIEEFIVSDASHNLPWKQSQSIAEKINNFLLAL